MATTTELLTANLHGVFGERDQEKRHAVVTSTYVEGVRFTDPEETVTGQAALEAKAAALLAGTPGFVFTEDGPVYAAGDHGALAWAFGPEGAAPVARGIDVITVVDGRISAVLTMLTQP